MKDNEIRALAQSVLRAEWAPLDVDRVDMESREDHLDEEALFFNAHLTAAPPADFTSKFITGQRKLRDALLDAGEKRFPYLHTVSPSGIPGQAIRSGPV